MMCAEDVIGICRLLEADGIQVWLTGGWGVDALLGEQTRPHKDLDVIMLVDDVIRMRELLDREGYGLKELWSENLWAMDASGCETATAFVLRDSMGREIDAHAMHLDAQGNGLPAWESEGLIFQRQDLAGEGLIGGVPVRCITPQMQVMCHTGYALPEVQVRDLELLHVMFDIR